LIHDILRQGVDVEILEPIELKNKIKNELEGMLAKIA
jgi:predicted DNA-binding transcriptional regulator YafY